MNVKLDTKIETIKDIMKHYDKTWYSPVVVNHYIMR